MEWKCPPLSTSLKPDPPVKQEEEIVFEMDGANLEGVVSDIKESRDLIDQGEIYVSVTAKVKVDTEDDSHTFVVPFTLQNGQWSTSVNILSG